MEILEGSHLPSRENAVDKLYHHQFLSPSADMFPNSNCQSRRKFIELWTPDDQRRRTGDEWMV